MTVRSHRKRDKDRASERDRNTKRERDRYRKKERERPTWKVMFGVLLQLLEDPFGGTLSKKERQRSSV